ncbi:MAG: hypothetical protein ACREXX_05140 [Gammaproteobacteria bacterium]
MSSTIMISALLPGFLSIPQAFEPVTELSHFEALDESAYIRCEPRVAVLLCFARLLDEALAVPASRRFQHRLQALGRGRRKSRLRRTPLFCPRIGIHQGEPEPRAQELQQALVAKGFRQEIIGAGLEAARGCVRSRSRRRR